MSAREIVSQPLMQATAFPYAPLGYAERGTMPQAVGRHMI